MAGSFSDKDEDEGLNEINVTPLVDVMLVLLIIFMVGTEFVQQQLKRSIPPNIPLTLPSAKSSVPTKPTVLSLVLDKNDTLYLDGKPSTLPAVEQVIETAKKAGNAHLEAVVAADERLTHGQVIRLIDKLRVWGISDIAINTKAQEID